MIEEQQGGQCVRSRERGGEEMNSLAVGTSHGGPCWYPKDFGFFVCLFVLAAPCGVRDPSSPTRDRICTPCIGSTES